MVSNSVQYPLVGRVAIYQGVYSPHWEIGHIRVRVPRTRKLILISLFLTSVTSGYALGWLDRGILTILYGLAFYFGILQSEERWCALFPHGFGEILDELQYYIEFEGIVSPRGYYGHLGYMNREVQILRVLKLRRRHV